MAFRYMRKITVRDDVFHWVLRGNTLDDGEKHITVFRVRAGTPLRIDPFVWEFEVRPKYIAEAIEFALENGWDPEAKGEPFYVSYREDRFFKLPPGIRFAYELSKTSGD